MPYSYLFDASALVTLLIKSPSEDARAAKGKLLRLLATEQNKPKPRFFVPNICMAECSSALAKIFLSDGHTEKRENAYRQHIDFLLDWVSSKKRHTIKTFKVKRLHLVDIEQIFVADRRLPGRQGNYLSGHDGIIISMGRDIDRKHGKGTTIILTTDRRIVDVCDHNRDWLPKAIDLADQEIPGI